MTLPPNIKEEIEKEAQEYTKAYEDEWFTIRDCYLKAATQFYIRDCYLKAAIQFYERGRQELRAKCAEAYNQGYDVAKSDMKKNTDAIAKAAFEAGRKTMAEIHGEGYGDDFGYPSSTNYLASDEYKKLVGGI